MSSEQMGDQIVFHLETYFTNCAKQYVLLFKGLTMNLINLKINPVKSFILSNGFAQKYSDIWLLRIGCGIILGPKSSPHNLDLRLRIDLT